MLPAGFDLRTIQIFILVADLGGMTPAAERLGISQSAVSQAIAGLEKLTDTKLFDRNIRPLALTNAGDLLYQHGNNLLAVAKDTFHEVRKKNRKSFSNVTIAMLESFAGTVGHLIIRDLKDQVENFKIWSGNSPDQHQELISHKVDILVTASPELDNMTGMEHYDIFSEPAVLVFPSAYVGQTESLEQLQDMPFMRYTSRSAIGRRIESQISRLGLDLPATAEFDTVTGQLKAVANGLGWCITTPLCLLQEIYLIDRLRVAPMKTGKFRRHISLIARKNEFGKLPSTIATTSQNILRNHSFPKLYKYHPWIEDDINWSSLQP